MVYATKEQIVAARQFSTERYIRSTHPVLYISGRRDFQGVNQFRSDDAYGYLCTRTGALWTPQGYNYDAVDDVISATGASTTALDFTTGLFSVSWWVKPSSTPSVGRMIIRAVFNTDGWGLYAAGAGIKVTFCPNALDKVLATSIITTNVWQLFTFVRTAAADGTLYKDAVSVGTTTALANITTSAAAFTIGTMGGYAALPGVWGEVLVHSRALTVGEVRQLYQVTKWLYR